MKALAIALMFVPTLAAVVFLILAAKPWPAAIVAIFFLAAALIITELPTEGKAGEKVNDEYPCCPLCGQRFGMDHADPSALCLDCQCCGDCTNNDLCIARGCQNPASHEPGPAHEDAFGRSSAGEK